MHELDFFLLASQLAPFCDSAPSRESVKRTSITALLGTNKQHELVIKIEKKMFCLKLSKM